MGSMHSPPHSIDSLDPLLIRVVAATLRHIAVVLLLDNARGRERVHYGNITADLLKHDGILSLCERAALLAVSATESSVIHPPG